MMRQGSDRSTTDVAKAAGCSAQLVRDLEAVGVIPLAPREPNGYRRFDGTHVAAVQAYLALSAAVGSTTAREVMQQLRRVETDVALARLSALHVDLTRRRVQALEALEALQAIWAEDGEVAEEEPVGPSTMTITELAEALGVRTSTLRFWEQEGLLTPDRLGRLAARSYPVRAIREARIVAALRAGGYGIPATAQVMAELGGASGIASLRETLYTRLDDISRRMGLLLRAGTDLVELVEPVHRLAATSTA